MLCNAMLCNAMQCYAMLCNAIQCYAMLCNAMQLMLCYCRERILLAANPGFDDTSNDFFIRGRKSTQNGCIGFYPESFFCF